MHRDFLITLYIYIYIYIINSLLSTYFYMEAKFGPSQKMDINHCHQSGWNFSEEQRGTLFLTTMIRRNSGRHISRTGWRETEKIQIRLTTTRNKNGWQQDEKNNAEMWTKWTKTTGKTSEENIRRDKTEQGLNPDRRRRRWWWWW